MPHPVRLVYSIIVLLGLTLTACAQPSPTSAPASNHGATGHATQSTAPFDQQFIDMMVPHHEGAVAMAKVAQTRAEHPEIKQLADAVVRDQDREIGLMKGWRKTWYGSDQTPPMNKMPMLGGMNHTMGNIDDDLKKLQTATPFDKAFIEMMIPHHQDAIAAAKLAQQQATKAEVKQLAGEIITAQEKEISQMREWLKAWYGV